MMAGLLRRTVALVYGAVLLAACDNVVAPAEQSAAPRPPVNALVVPVSGFKDITTSLSTTCAAGEFGTVECWGNVFAGYQPPPLTDAVAVQLGGGHGCAIRSAGQLVCWGALDSEGAAFGQATVPTDLGAVTQVSTGFHHTCALTAAQRVRCWGRDDRGQSTPPTDLPAITQVTTGLLHSCAVTTASTVRCWGQNSGTELIPATEQGIVQIDAAQQFTCAVFATGTVRCYADPFVANAYGLTPPAELTDAVQVSAGEQNVCAVRRSGRVICWGDNSLMQTNVPGDLTDAVRVSVVGFYACALRRTGAVRCWGANFAGQATPPTRTSLPIASFVYSPEILLGKPYTLSMVNPRVPGADVQPSFTFSFDCGDGVDFRPASATNTVTCTTDAYGTKVVRAKVIDESGDFREYLGAVVVVLSIEAIRTNVAESTIRASLRAELVDILTGAQQALDRGQRRRVCSALRDFAGKVRVQRGRAIPVATADRWLLWTSQLQRELSC